MHSQQLAPKQFQKLIFSWFDKHGRKHLPWQQNKTPYRVWVSEIMLQQTQVTTVIPYFERFMQKFPDIQSLANASEDEVLHLWTGLGYYTRARNLHRTAKIITQEFKQTFPDEIIELEKLPGIGRSTAGAILSIAFQQPATILDGNVKRVLTRFLGITEWPGEKQVLELLWQTAEYFTPKQRTADYSQAMMDLGATLCTRGKPDCETCPLSLHCIAHKKGLEKTIPRSKPKKTLPIKQATLLLFQKKHHVLLEKRPPTGIWGGLWVPPQLNDHATTQAIKQHCKKTLGFTIESIRSLEIFRHTFSHFHLEILPVLITAKSTSIKVMDSQQQIWYNLHDSQPVGLPAPVKKILRSLTWFEP